MFCTNGTLKIYEIKESGGEGKDKPKEVSLEFANELFWYDIHDVKTEPIEETSVMVIK